MATLESTRPVQFTIPLSNPSIYKRNTLWPPKTSHVNPSLTSSQKARRPAATAHRARCRVGTERNTTERAEGRRRALADSDEESDDDFPSPEELSRTALHGKVSTEASKREFTIQRLEQPGLNEAGLQVDQIQAELSEGSSRDQPVILDDDDSDEAAAVDDAEGASGDVDTGRVEGDTGPQNTSATSELASEPTKSIDVSGPWYDIEEGRYIEEPAPRPGPREQQGMPSALARGQPETLLQSSTPLQDDEITRSPSMGSAPYSLLQPSDTGDYGWTDDLDELDKELRLALTEHGKLSLACAPRAPSPRSAEASQDEIQSRERAEITGSRPAELQDTSQCGTPGPGLGWEQRQAEQVEEKGAVAIQQQEERAAQKNELGQPAVGGQQDPVEVVDVDDTEPRAPSPHPLNEAQSEIHSSHSATPIDGKHRDALRTSRGSSCPAEPSLGSEPAARKRRHQDTHTEISNETHHSTNTDDDHDTCDTGSEDPRPAKRRKPRSTPAALHLQRSSTVDNTHHYASRTSRSPSAVTEAVPFAEYQEWPFQGFLKRTKIGDDVTYNLEFNLPPMSEYLHLPITPAALDINHDATTHSKVHQALLKPKKSKVAWTTEEDATLVQMKRDDYSWEEISAALPRRSIGTIQVRYSTKFRK